MAKLDGRRSTPGLGSTRNSNVVGMRRIVVAFDDDTFAEIRAKALKDRRSFACVVRELVEWGLMEGDE